MCVHSNGIFSQIISISWQCNGIGFVHRLSTLHFFPSFSFIFFCLLNRPICDNYMRDLPTQQHALITKIPLIDSTHEQKENKNLNRFQ